jgi:hypothetical protein
LLTFFEITMINEPTEFHGSTYNHPFPDVLSGWNRDPKEVLRIATGELDRWQELMEVGDNYASEIPDAHIKDTGCSLICEANYCWLEMWVNAFFAINCSIREHSQLRAWCQLQNDVLDAVASLTGVVRRKVPELSLHDKDAPGPVDNHSWTDRNTIQLALPLLYGVNLPENQEEARSLVLKKDPGYLAASGIEDFGLFVWSNKSALTFASWTNQLQFWYHSNKPLFDWKPRMDFNALASKAWRYLRCVPGWMRPLRPKEISGTLGAHQCLDLLIHWSHEQSSQSPILELVSAAKKISRQFRDLQTARSSWISEVLGDAEFPSNWQEMIPLHGAFSIQTLRRFCEDIDELWSRKQAFRKTKDIPADSMAPAVKKAFDWFCHAIELFLNIQSPSQKQMQLIIYPDANLDPLLAKLDPDVGIEINWALEILKESSLEALGDFENAAASLLRTVVGTEKPSIGEQEVEKVQTRSRARKRARRIPPEYRTIPLTLKSAAILMGYRKRGELRPRSAKKAAEILSQSIQDGTVVCEKLGRQRFVFDRRDFPKEALPDITPKN